MSDTNDKYVQPTNLEEYRVKYRQSHKVIGEGVDEVEVHMPCPFCAAPDFIVYRVAEMGPRLMDGSTCKECERGAHCEYVPRGRQVFFEIVHTIGPEQPEWLTCKARRAVMH